MYVESSKYPLEKNDRSENEIEPISKDRIFQKEAVQHTS
jgi:hypothetical protein